MDILHTWTKLPISHIPSLNSTESAITPCVHCRGIPLGKHYKCTVTRQYISTRHQEFIQCKSLRKSLGKSLGKVDCWSLLFTYIPTMSTHFGIVCRDSSKKGLWLLLCVVVVWSLEAATLMDKAGPASIHLPTPHAPMFPSDRVINKLPTLMGSSNMVTGFTPVYALLGQTTPTACSEYRIPAE